MHRFPLPATTLGLLLTATATYALPVDVGRTADVFTNAVRYFDARSAEPNNWPAPRPRPADLVASAPAVEADPVEDAFDEDALDGDALLTADAGDAVLSGQDAVDADPDVIAAQADPVAVETVPADFAVPAEVVVAALGLDLDLTMDDGLRRAVEAAAAARLPPEIVADVPEPIAIAVDEGLKRAVEDALVAEQVAASAPALVVAMTPDEGLLRAVSDAEAVDVAVPVLATLDEGLRRAVEGADAAAFAAFEDPEALLSFGPEVATLAGAPGVDGLDVSVGSSRQAVTPEVAVVPVAGGAEGEPVVAPEAGVDLMSVMAEADGNLIIRDGGENRPDTMMMSSDVLFAFGSATLAEEALTTLASIGAMAGDVPVIQVFGHTDAIGSEANNLSLGQARAESVRDWLLQNTPFTQEQVIATGIGEVDPIAPNLQDNGDDNPGGRAQNRRVEFAFHEAGFVPEN